MRKLVATAAALAALLSGPAVWAAEPGTIGYLSKHTTLGVKIYSDLSYIRNQSNGTEVNPTGYGFDVKRGYLTLDTAFNDDWSVRFRTDFNYKSQIGETNVYIKNLYAQRKFDHGIKLRIGVADLPWVPYLEHLYRYRYVEHVLIDRTKFGTSADWGVHLLGDEGKINWDVALVSGAGYKHPERSRGMDVTGRIDFQPVKHFHIVLGARTGKLGKDTQEANAAHTATRYDAVVAYEADRWNVGLDYFYANDYQNVTTEFGNSADGYSLFGSWSITPAVALFARYDYVKPCRDTTPACDSGLKNNYYNAGVQFTASKQINFALVYKYSKVDNGQFATENGLIGGPPTPNGPGEGKYQEIGIFMQAAF